MFGLMRAKKKRGAPLRVFAVFMIIVFFFAWPGAGEQERGEKSQPGQRVVIKEPGQKKYRGAKADFHFKDADLRNVILQFARTYKLNVVLDPGIKGKVTCHLTQVPWDQALEVILRQHGLAMEENGNIISVFDLFKDKKK